MPLSGREIKRWLELDFPNKLVITPLMSESQLPSGGASVDLRLGHEFIIGDRSIRGQIDPTEIEHAWELGTYLRKIYVPVGGRFALHPRQFALAATLEYVRLPLRLTAQVIGRSRWARVGLIIEMASFVHPGYAGCLTLELQDLGDLPISLSPGFAVAQLVLDECDWGEQEPEQDAGQLTCAISPQFSPLLSDEDRRVMKKMQPSTNAVT